MDPRIVDFFVNYRSTARKVQCTNNINNNVLQFWYMIRSGGGGRGVKKRDSLQIYRPSASFFVYRAKMKGPPHFSRTVNKINK